MTATSAPGYFHALDGRLRIGVPSVKRSPENALRVERQLGILDGITHVSANPKTGNVLILYDADQLEQMHVLETLHALGHLEEHPEVFYAKRTAPVGNAVFEKLPANIARNLVEFALQHAITALL